jgi:flagellar protein FliS
MGYNAHDAYLESRVLSADPIELVRLLYQAATAAVREARRQLADGEIAPRARSVSKACAILTELAGSLDFERGGEISLRLAELYDYMQRRLLEANVQQSEAPLADVLGLLTTLSEAWDGVHQQTTPPVPPENPWAQPMPPEPAVAHESSGWAL